MLNQFNVMHLCFYVIKNITILPVYHVYCKHLFSSNNES